MTQAAPRRAIMGWAMYDFANSAFTTLVVTFIYATYFTKAIAPDELTGTALWSRGVTVTALVVALLSPLAGAAADAGGLRRRALASATLVCVLASAALYGALPGETLKALTWFVIANIGFEMGMVFYNAFLPDLAPAKKIGRISGFGWGLGYVGGLLALIVALVTLVQPETPWLGFSRDNGENIRATCLLVAVWYGVFSLPLFLFVKEPARPKIAAGALARQAYRQLGATFREIRRYREIVWLLIARLFYNDGLVTIFAFGGIYAAGTFGFSFQEIMTFGIVLNIAAGAGAFLMGILDDILGARPTIILSLLGLMLATLIATFAPSKTWFWISGILVGLFSGPNQSASRSLLGRFTPPGKESEFFGFFAFSGKATAFAGPLLLGILTEQFQSQRIGISVVLGLFVIGLVLLLRVNEAAGTAAAGRTAA